jgi:hypothetical protein
MAASSTGCPITLAVQSQKVRRVTNPFARRNTGRDHFPIWDLAFSFSPQKSEDADGSIFSQSSSSLDLSIGAKAALYEHMRHIEKHGLDGAPAPENSMTPRHPLDEKWDLLLDGGLFRDENDTSADETQKLGLDVRLFAAKQEGDESIEVMTDSSSDYFNSSRVMMLGTPERNKMVINMVSIRGEASSDVFFSDESDIAETHSCIAPERDIGLDLSHEHPSFLSLSAADVSRISASDWEAKGSPDVSVFDFRIATEDSNFINIIDSSFSSDSRRSSSESDKEARSSVSARNQRQQRSTLFNADKENTITAKIPNQAKKAAKISSLSAVSMPSSNANNIVRTESNSVASSNQVLPMLSTHVNTFSGINLLRELQDATYKAPSPKMKPSSLDRGRCSSCASFSATRTEHDRGGNTSSSGRSSSGSLTGRRRFRTVVPSRVFITEPSEFPDENDSFSTKSASSKASPLKSKSR